MLLSKQTLNPEGIDKLNLNTDLNITDVIKKRMQFSLSSKFSMKDVNSLVQR